MARPISCLKTNGYSVVPLPTTLSVEVDKSILVINGTTVSKKPFMNAVQPVVI